MKYLLGSVIVMIILAAILFLIYSSFLLGGCPRRGKAFDQWDSTSRPFTIRIIAYEEEGRSFSASRPYYIFQSNALGPEDWREIMTIQDESRPEIPKEQVRFVNEQIAYVFMGTKCAVTTDGGRTWFVWDTGKTLPKTILSNHRIIKQVSIAANGSGTMELEAERQSQGEMPELRTTDYGYHWNLE